MASETGFILGKNARLVCLGDSITENPAGYVSVLHNLIMAGYPERNIVVVNSGISGHKAPDMLARLERDVVNHRPTCVTINVGINDVWHGFATDPDGTEHPMGDGPNGVALERYEACLTQMVAQLRETTDAEIVFCTPTVIGEDVDNPDCLQNTRLQSYVTAMKRVAALHSVLLAHTHEDFVQAIRAGRAANPDYRLTTDGVHMNPVGDCVMALSILAALGYAGLAG